MITTAELQGLTAPILAEVFAALGHDLTIHYTPDDATYGTPAAQGGLSVPVRGLLMPAEVRTKTAAAAAGLPVPHYAAYLPYGVGGVVLDLTVPGWHIEHEGQRYYPTADARNEGGQGLLWVCELGAPGEVSTVGTSEPDWTATP